jgi:hypothetical protein
MSVYYSIELNTVKLGYNDHGYNELTVIANKYNLLVWFRHHYSIKFHAYNEQIFGKSRL